MYKEINIMDVVHKNNIRITGRSGISHRATCPLCGGKSTLSITPSMGLFQCFLCGAGGNAFKLDSILNPTEYGEGDYKKFAQNMESWVNGTPRREEKDIEVFEETPRASDEQCSKVYSAMIKLLSLKKEHLLRRGLSEADIKAYCFRTAPNYNERYSIPRKLVEKGYNLEGVPGFFKDGGKWCVKSPKGYLCPVFDGEKNLLIGFQTRLDKPIDGNKYIWFSSIGKEAGTSSGILSSILPGEYDKTALVVEGTLKGLITYLLLGKKVTVITVPGVNSISCLNYALEQFEGKLIFECYDMDKYTTFDPEKAQTDEEKKLVKKSRDVMKGVVKLEEKCNEFDITTHHMKWNFSNGLWNGEGKGIDDFLLTYAEPTKMADYIIKESEKFLKMKAILH